MNTSAAFASRYLKLGLIGIVAVCCGCGGSPRQGHTDTASEGAVPTQTQANAPLSANDVSWLFHVPTRAQDFANLIAVSDITTPNPQDPTKRDPVWTDATFQRFLDIVNGPQTQVAGTHSKVSLPVEARVIGAWFVAGIRDRPALSVVPRPAISIEGGRHKWLAKHSLRPVAR